VQAGQVQVPKLFSMLVDIHTHEVRSLDETIEENRWVSFKKLTDEEGRL
jgi:hypothetical protein